MTQRDLALIAGSASKALAATIAAKMKTELTPARVGRFPDGEIDVQINDNVRGSDVFLIQSTCPPVNDHLMELLILIDAARRASARRITAVIPYFGYARKDRKDEGRVPITAKLVANMLTEAGANRVLTIDLHAAQIQGFFDVPVDHLYASAGVDAALHRSAHRATHDRRAGCGLIEDGPRLCQPPRRRSGDHEQAAHQRGEDRGQRSHR